MAGDYFFGTKKSIKDSLSKSLPRGTRYTFSKTATKGKYYVITDVMNKKGKIIYHN